MTIIEDKRTNQIKSLLISPNAMLKIIGAGILWKLTGLFLAFMFNFGIFIIFIVILFAILWFFPYWQPAYSIIHRIVGNNEISPNLEQYHFGANWWNLILLGIKLAFLLYILYMGIKIILQ